MRAEKLKTSGRQVLFVTVSRDEADQIIHSLTAQIIANSPNVGRWTTCLEDGTDFTMAVEAELAPGLDRRPGRVGRTSRA